MNTNSSQPFCAENLNNCSFIDPNGTCLSDEKVLELIFQYVIPTYYEWICIILYLIVFLVGTIGNLLVIIVIKRHRNMRTVTNIFIMNLAAADLLVLVFCLPATVVQDVTKTWFFGLILCKFVNYVQNMSISVSVLTLMAISIERYQAIVYPLRFSGTKQRARIFILSVWILSILLVLPDAIMMTLTRHFGDRLQTKYLTYCQWNAHPLADLIYQLHISLCLFVIPLCFMVFTYSGIVRVLWGSLPTERILHDDKRAINSSQHTLSGQTDESHLNGPSHNSTSLMNPGKSANLIVQENRQKAAKMLISVVIIFAICYTPVHVFNLFRYVYVYAEHMRGAFNQTVSNSSDCRSPDLIDLQRTETNQIVTISALISHFLPYFNSSVNPIIYNIMSDKFRLKFRELFSSYCCCCKSSLRMKTSSSTTRPFQASSVVHNAARHESVVSNNAFPRFSNNSKYPRVNNSCLLVKTVNDPLVKTSMKNSNRSGPSTNSTSYSNHGQMVFRLTNV